ncbi:MAG TPA: biopolymer transporter ExbD [Burkholderiales bacterium]|jgi:biopolymer transport protein ExbD|nr:biopolymer transporter ExbD [Burkholderiales bacterium]
MNFRRGSFREEPELNLVPFIDVLIVIVIFLAVTTSYSRFSELQINLPTADANKPADRPSHVSVGVSASGQYVVNRAAVAFGSPEAFAGELRKAAGSNPDPVIIINADASATHQSVINVMEAARLAGFGKITFTTQQHR